jgi:hypothetical protein
MHEVPRRAARGGVGALLMLSVVASSAAQAPAFQCPALVASTTRQPVYAPVDGQPLLTSCGGPV